jgi:hypothetical protein
MNIHLVNRLRQTQPTANSPIGREGACGPAGAPIWVLIVIKESFTRPMPWRGKGGEGVAMPGILSKLSRARSSPVNRDLLVATCSLPSRTGQP